MCTPTPPAGDGRSVAHLSWRSSTAAKQGRSSRECRSSTAVLGASSEGNSSTYSDTRAGLFQAKNFGQRQSLWLPWQHGGGGGRANQGDRWVGAHLQKVGEALPVEGHALLQDGHVGPAELDELEGQHGLVEKLGRERGEELAEDRLRVHSCRLT